MLENPPTTSTHPLSRLGTLLLVAVVALTGLTAAACGDTGSDTGPDTGPEGAVASDSAAGTGTSIRRLDPVSAAELLRDPPEGLVVVDVRTYDEYATGHLGDALLVDYYAEDFADRLAELPRDRPYLVYCRSGNRSGETLRIMQELGFTDVVDIDGGILAWEAAGLPVTR